jgi:predicted DNA-binding protein
MYPVRPPVVNRRRTLARGVVDSTLDPGEDGRASERRHGVQQTIRVPTEVGDQLRLLATLTGTDEEEHLRRAVHVYLETSGRESEIAAFTGRARERLRAVLDRLGDL